MKKGILLFVGLLFLGLNVEAKATPKSVKNNGFENSYYASVSFVERGIHFDVFLNGDFDFEAIRRNRRYDRRYRQNRLRIRRNHRGQISSVGNVSIRYDLRGNVRRIGSVYIRYRRGRITNVGNLRVRYNRWGDPRFYGAVRHQYISSPDFVCDYNDAYFYGNEFRNNYRLFRQDANFYYYRAHKNARTSRNKILKRRKQVVTKREQPTKRTTRKVIRRSKRS